MNAKLRVLKYLIRKVNTHVELAVDHPAESAEYLQDAKHYGEILYTLIREGLLP
jgi:hypothetical protein